MTNSELLTQRFGLQDKVAIVTGAGSGIGKEIAHLFAAVGAKVVVADINQQAGEAVANELTSNGHTAVAIETNIADESSVTSMVENTIRQFNYIDILVNNAGVFPVDQFLDTSIDRWDQVQSINLRGPFLCMREVLKHMREAKRGGRVINISSSASLLPTLYDEIPYNVSKAGLNMLTRAAALEFATEEITINAVIPAFVITEGAIKSAKEGPKRRGPALNPERRPMGRFGEPADIANAALYLASPAASYVTGHLLCCDGGYTTIS